MRIGERLIEAGLISADVLDAGLRTQGQYGGRLVSVLVELKALDGDAGTRILSTQKRAPAALKKHFDAADRNALARVPAKVAEKYGAVPLGFTGANASTMVVAMIDPGDFRAVEELQIITGMKIMPGAALEVRIREALRRYYKVGAEQRQFLGVAAAGNDIDDFTEPTAYTTKSVQNTHVNTHAPSEAMRVARPAPDLTLDRAPPSSRAPADPYLTPRAHLAAPQVPSYLEAPPLPPQFAPPPHFSSPPQYAPPPELQPPSAPPFAATVPPSAPPFAATVPPSAPPFAAARAATPAPPRPRTPAPIPYPAREPTPQFARSPYAEYVRRPDPDPGSREAPTQPAMPAVTPPPPIHEVESPRESDGGAPVASPSPSTVSWSVPPSRPPQRAGFSRPIPRGDPEDGRGAAKATPDVLVASDAIRRIEQASSLEQKVELLLVYMKGLFEACVVFAVRNDIAFTWKAFGPGIRGAVPPKIAIPLTQPSLLQMPYEARTPFCGPPTADGADMHARLWETLRTRPPKEALAIPIVIDDKVAAIVYAHLRADARIAGSVLTEASSVCAAISRR